MLWTKSRRFAKKVLLQNFTNEYYLAPIFCVVLLNSMAIPCGYKVKVAEYYNDDIMSALVSRITSRTIVYSTAYSRRRSKKTLTIRVTGHCKGNSAVTREFPAQSASAAENVSIWWRHHDKRSIESVICGALAPMLHYCNKGAWKCLNRMVSWVVNPNASREACMHFRFICISRWIVINQFFFR